jgi:hypothetical protein
MHVDDAWCEALCSLRGISAGVGEMAGVEQQSNVIASRLHQALDISRRLHHRTHMMVIGEP